MSRIKTIKFPLFWKFSFIAVVIVLIFGSINILLLWSSVYRSFEKEIDKRCIVLSKIVAEKVFTPLVYDNVVNIYSVLDEAKISDPSIAYIFLLDVSGNIIAKTSDFSIPQKLITANKVIDGKYQIKVIETENYNYKIIRDIAFPIIHREVGSVRLGIVEEDIRKELNDSSNMLLLMIFIFLVIGLGSAFFFSYLITSPIKAISIRAQNVNLDTIEQEEFKIDTPKYKKIMSLYFEDELDLLVSKFNLMMIRLKDNVLEMKNRRDAFVQTEKLASIGTLTAGIGHEINNPLSGMQNCINRILKEPSNIKQNIKYLDLIKEATNKIETIIQQLLNFSRKQNVIFEKVNPVDILENSINLVLYKLEKNDIKVEYNICCIQYINASINHLSQVFLNLLINSIDAINQRKKINPILQGEINISLECKNGKSIININDNGTGIKPENKNNIFDPFFTTKEVGKGTGLGLYVSYGIIKEHGGNMSFKSTFGKGTEFIIEFPLIETKELKENFKELTNLSFINKNY